MSGGIFGGILPGFITNPTSPAVASDFGVSYGANAETGIIPSEAYFGDALFATYRAIGTVIPQVLIEEVNRDDVEITKHPVEFGSPITDHSYKQPVEVMLRVGWSNAGNYPGYINDVYNALLDLQASRQPFDVFTGKRHYTNMLFASLIQVTNEGSSDHALMVQALLREIIIVSTSAVQAPASSLPSQTSNTPAVTTQGPQPVTNATNNALNTQSSTFTDAGSLDPVAAL